MVMPGQIAQASPNTIASRPLKAACPREIRKLNMLLLCEDCNFGGVDPPRCDEARTGLDPGRERSAERAIPIVDEFSRLAGTRRSTPRCWAGGRSARPRRGAR